VEYAKAVVGTPMKEALAMLRTIERLPIGKARMKCEFFGRLRVRLPTQSWQQNKAPARIPGVYLQESQQAGQYTGVHQWRYLATLPWTTSK
jgi:hypothetical protein